MTFIVYRDTITVSKIFINKFTTRLYRASIRDFALKPASSFPKIETIKYVNQLYLSEFIFNHTLYARLLLLRDPDWVTQLDSEQHLVYITAPISKLQVSNHTLYQTTA